MGKIDRLVLNNFKSYRGQTTLGPFTDFTAIIGPNGSGKSNILDAVSFVMGVKSSSLRGQRLEDLIYKSAGQTGEIEPEVVNDAYVELIYTLNVDELDEFDEHERFEGGNQLRFRRSIHRASGQPVNQSSGSQYRVNGKVTSWSDYNAMLERIGVSVKGKNFLVFQGDVESIAQKSDAEFAQMIDTLSGSAALREEYDKAKAATEDADLEFLHLANRRKQVAKERKQLKAQKDEADEFAAKMEEIKKKRQELYLWSFWCLCEEETVKTRENEQLTARLADKQEAVREAQDELENMISALAQRKKAQSAAEKKLTDRSKQLDKKRPDEAKLKEEIKYANKKIDQLKKELKSLESQRAEHGRLVSRLEADLANVREQLQKLSQEEKTESERGAAIRLHADDREEYLRLKKQVNSTVAALNEEMSSLNSKIRALNDSITSRNSLINDMKDRRGTHESTVKELRARADRLTEELEEIRRQVAANTKKQSDNDKQIRSQNKQITTLQTELSASMAQLDTYESQRVESSRAVKMREILEVLQHRYAGIRGRLRDLIRVPESRYGMAVSVALGRHGDSIVVDHEKTAVECIAYMKEQRLGTATFIPLDSVRVKEVNERLRTLSERRRPNGAASTARLVFDVIQQPDYLHRAVLYAVADTLVTDTMDEARELAYEGRNRAADEEDRMKIVTVDGSVIHRNGNMTGGRSRKQTAVPRFDEVEFQRLSARKVEIISILTGFEKSDLAEEQRTIAAQLEQQKLSLSNIEAARKQALDDVNKKEQTIRDIDARIAQLEPENDSDRESLTDLERQLADVDRRVQVEEDRVFRDFVRRLGGGITSIRQYEQGRLAAVESYVAQKSALSEHEATLASKLAYEAERDRFEADEKQIKTQIKAQQKNLTDAETKLKAKTAEIDADKEALADLAESVRRATEAADDQERSVKEKQAQHTELQSQVAALSKVRSSTEAQIEVIREEKRELVRTVRVEGIELPMKGRGSQTAKRGRGKPSPARKRRRRDEDEDGDEDMEEGPFADDVEMDGETTGSMLSENVDPADVLDFRSVPSSMRDLSHDREAVRARALAEIADLRAAADKLAPNMKAADKFEEVNERAETMRSELEAARAHVTSLQDEFTRIKEERTRLFMAAFKHLQQAIQHIYSSLTAGVDLPMGGKASLYLSSEDEPYAQGVTYTVMPPMKRYMPMRALSGGEKTVASLALVFALHSFKPSPFFVLDEIDAALDNINVTRVSNYVRARALRDQLQCIVISLKETFYSRAQSLVGIYRDIISSSSGVLSIDLTKYDVPAEH